MLNLAVCFASGAMEVRLFRCAENDPSCQSSQADFRRTPDAEQAARGSSMDYSG